MHYPTAAALRARIVAVATSRNAPEQRTEDYVYADLDAVVEDIMAGATHDDHGGFAVGKTTLSQLAELLDRHVRRPCDYDPEFDGGEGGRCRRVATHAVWRRPPPAHHPLRAFCGEHTPVVLATRKSAGFEGAFAEPLTAELLDRHDARPQFLNATVLGVFDD